jgi:hypothetical protein
MKVLILERFERATGDGFEEKLLPDYVWLVGSLVISGGVGDRVMDDRCSFRYV